jgi:hypothetical protein
MLQPRASTAHRLAGIGDFPWPVLFLTLVCMLLNKPSGGSVMMTRLLAGVLGAGLLLAPFSVAADKDSNSKKQMDEDMRRAIAFEHYKDVAAARQARKEAKHPSVTYSNADRSSDRDTDANRVKDPGPKK